MAGGKFVPDITGIKGEDIASFLPNANRFVDLNTLGADKIALAVPGLEVEAGHLEGRQAHRLPDRHRPDRLYYREDLFAKAGLPTDPAQIAPLVATWDGYFEVGQRIHKALPKSFLINNIGSIFSLIIGQGTTRFIDDEQPLHRRPGPHPHGLGHLGQGPDARHRRQDQRRQLERRRSATAPWPPKSVPPGMRWTSATPRRRQAGKWRVAPNPGGPANHRRLVPGDPEVLPATPRLPSRSSPGCSSPDNEARGFTDAALFPATPDAYTLPALTTGGPVLRRPEDDRRVRTAGAEDPGSLRGPCRRRRVRPLLRRADECRDGQGPREGGSPTRSARRSRSPSGKE